MLGISLKCLFKKHEYFFDRLKDNNIYVVKCKNCNKTKEYKKDEICQIIGHNYALIETYKASNNMIVYIYECKRCRTRWQRTVLETPITITRTLNFYYDY